ncbi:hypothetical protein PoB_002653700 [Plakobranchus ocellatus]|uniref:Uncharacterized protein n=1 Tax=Plakobranchus ocellatus TaxID=259542 RepID=A0AAV3ZZD0_9GAST|nr:hypothetical protein PoB_002653700 [Plakobranchus ocellatus]
MTAKKWILALFGFFAIVCITNVCYCDDNAGAGTDDLDNTTPENCSTTSDVSNDGRCNTSNNIAVDRNRKHIFDNETRSPNDTSTPEPHSTDTTATHSQSPNDLITTISIRPGDEANTTKNDTLPTPKTTSSNGTDDDASTSSDRTPGSDVIPSGNESTSNVNPPDHGDSTAAPGNDTTDAASTVKPPCQDKPAEDPGFPDVIKRRGKMLSFCMMTPLTYGIIISLF